MSARGSIRVVGICVVLCGLALASVYQHYWSVRVTRDALEAEEEFHLLSLRADSLQSELARLESFCRLESLYRWGRGYSQLGMGPNSPLTVQSRKVVRTSVTLPCIPSPQGRGEKAGDGEWRVAQGGMVR